MGWGPASLSPSMPPPAPDGLRKRRNSSSSPAFLPASFQHPAGSLTQDQTPRQNQVPWPTWADVLSLISPSPIWASWGVEPAPVCASPVCPCPINMFPTGQGGLLPAPHHLGSPCGPRANGCCMEKCLSWPSPCLICTEQGCANLSQTHK